MAPTRELAIQLFNVVKLFTKTLDIRAGWCEINAFGREYPSFLGSIFGAEFGLFWRSVRVRRRRRGGADWYKHDDFPVKNDDLMLRKYLDCCNRQAC